VEAKRGKLHAVLKSNLGLDDLTSLQLVDDAVTADRGAIDLYHFTRQLSDVLDDEGRRRVVKMVWEVAYVDESINEVASNIIWRVSRKAAKEAPVVTRMKELSAQYPRYGYRRIRIFIARDGHRMSPGRAHRLWQTARLQVPRKRLRKRIAAAPRARPQTPSGPNQVWCYDFVFDHCANGQQLKCLTVADEFTKEGLAIEVDGRIRSARVIEVLSRLVSARGAPRFLRSDNGPEFVSKALLSWIVAQGIGTALIEPGKPWQNGVAESFNGKFRDECLSLEWFRSRAETN
jgi:putative transposase